MMREWNVSLAISRIVRRAMPAMFDRHESSSSRRDMIVSVRELPRAAKARRPGFVQARNRRVVAAKRYCRQHCIRAVAVDL